jgi:predicted enzyme related to lactoylglutathione lyase
MVKLDHIRIAVRDWRATRDWYQKHFGLKVEFEVPDGGDAKLGVAAMQDDSGLTLFLDQIEGGLAACACINYFQVASVDESYGRLSASGVKFLHPPQKFYWGYGAELAEPDGHVIRIWDERSMQGHKII